MSPKPVYLNLNEAPIGSAVSWLDVAAIVSKRVGSISVNEVQQHASEGPRGFYVTLRVRPVRR